LGWDPIENLTQVLEDHGVKVGQLDAHEDFDALTLWANDTFPVIVVKHGLPGDRQRYNLAHELGHLVIRPAAGVDAEKAAHRFAGAFLAPEPMARPDLGERRVTLDLLELHLLKHKYGLSMQAWIYRAKDLGIISEASATQLFKEFRRRGWHLKEPGDAIPPEESARSTRLVLRALTEDVISEGRAAELLGCLWRDFGSRRESSMRDSQSPCVVDANVLIDLHKGRLLADLWRLQCRVIVPDVIAAELIDPDGTRLAEVGLEVHDFSGDQVLEVTRLRLRFNQVSTNDLFALVLAKELQAILLTGDRHLRQIADQEGVAVHGTLWVLDELVQLRIIDPHPIVQRLWNYCNVLRDDGVSYGDYVEQLTYLLFLKMDDEQARRAG
jgi:Zn-dependent peptidase ImmA (M78 family)/predicted nucleic acid-binding protein